MSKYKIVTFVAAIIFSGLGVGVLVGLSVSPVISIVVTSITGAMAAFGAATQNSDKNLTLNPLPLALLTIGIVIGTLLGILARNHDVLAASTPPIISQWSEVTDLNQDAVARRIFEYEYPYSQYSSGALWLSSSSSNVVSSTLESEVELWSSLGISRTVVLERLFELRYPLKNSSTVQPLPLQKNLDNNSSTIESDIPSDLLSSSTIVFAVSTSTCVRLRLTDATELKDEIKLVDDDLFSQLSNTIESPDTLKMVIDLLCTSTSQ